MRSLAVHRVMSILTFMLVGWVCDARAQFFRPAGLFALSQGTQPPSTELLAKPFIDGFVLRVPWSTLETAEGVYDFSSIDATLAALAPSRKLLSLTVIQLLVPAYVLQNPAVQTYAVAAGGGDLTNPVPWNDYALQRWEALWSALASHVAPDPARGGTAVPLADHSLLYIVDGMIVGMNGIRDPQGRLVAVPNYDREAVVTGILRSLHACLDRFQRPFAYTGFFRMTDNIASPAFDAYLLGILRQEFFDGSSTPRLGLFEENLACSTPAASFAFALDQERGHTYTMFQMLQSWVNPFLNPARTDACLVTTTPGDRGTATSGPEVGIQYAYQTFDCRYFEIYISDLQHPGFGDEFQTWHDILRPLTGVRPSASERMRFAIERNPASARGVTFLVDAPRSSRGALQIYDVTGRRICEPWRGEIQPGISRLRWNGRDERGRGAASGLYIARLKLGSRTFARKLVLAP
jgi:hypothetical protein